VQKPPGDAAVASHSAGIRRPGQHTSTAARQATFSQTSFSQIRETKNRAYEFTARRSLHTGIFPDEVRWKNLLRRLRVSLPAGKPFPDSRFRIFNTGAGEGI
jgi:hypothetical protein